MTNYAVELKNVCKRFPLPTGGELEACKSINITLEKGESLGIVGESGSGKNDFGSYDYEDAAYHRRRDLCRWCRDSTYEL